VFGNGFSGVFVEFGGFLVESVDGAVDVGVVLLVVIRDGFDDLPRLLRGGGVVKVD